MKCRKGICKMYVILILILILCIICVLMAFKLYSKDKLNKVEVVYWKAEGKSESDIEEAYYCARTNIFNFKHEAYHKKGSNFGTRQLFAYMHNPHLKIPTIHVTGTNGKGSVIRKLAGCFREAGYKVGEYTSPWLYTMREDITLNLQLISKSDFVKYHQMCAKADRDRRKGFQKLLDKPGSNGYYFCIAMNYFVGEKADIALVEVAAGGYKDHTNFINPEISIITNVQMDHLELGDTKEKILYQKTGVIKPGKPVVLGHDMPLHIAIEEANKKNSSYHIIYPTDINNFTFDELNSKTALKVIELIKNKFPAFTNDSFTRGLSARMHGRKEMIDEQILKKVAISWKLPKLPHRVFHEFKSNIGNIQRIIQEMRQGYPEYKLRVGITGYRETLAEERIIFILRNVDFVHFVEGNFAHSLHYGNYDMNKLLNEASFDKSNFELIDEKSVGGPRDLEKVVRHIFRKISLSKDDEVLLLIGFTEEIPKIFDYEFPKETYPTIIPTESDCENKGIRLIPKYKYRY